MNERLRILITNDDGIYADGINVLASTLSSIYDVTVVAPDRQKSASGHSLTIDDILVIKDVTMPSGLRGIAVVDGTPTDCVLIAVKDIMKDNPPDILISGINHGANLGGDVIYSGTVSAALEGLTQGIKSFAVSLDMFEKGHFETAARVVMRIIEEPEFYRDIVQEKSILNINVPNIPYERVMGISITRQGNLSYQNYVEKYSSPTKRTFYWIGGDRPPHEIDEETDSYALSQKMVSVTPINIELTNFNLIPRLKKAVVKLRIP
ncbi:MAG: 5'/3'-nucleotidase SurE [Caldisericaceae bacterium]